MNSPQANFPDALLRASQGRVEELERALQDAYTWAYTSGEPSEIADLLEAAGVPVPVPAEIVTRNRMIEVWEEGFNKFHGWTIPPENRSAHRELFWMLHYTYRMQDSLTVDRATVREWLWKIARAASNLLSPGLDVLSPALEEYSRASKQHPDMTLECDGHTDETRLFALVEEIGEVAACLTYDNDAETGHNSDLESAVIQVIALALAWATRYLEEQS